MSNYNKEFKNGRLTIEITKLSNLKKKQDGELLIQEVFELFSEIIKESSDGYTEEEIKKYNFKINAPMTVPQAMMLGGTLFLMKKDFDITLSIWSKYDNKYLDILK